MRTYPSPIEIQIGILSPLVTSFDLNNRPPDLVVPQRGPEEVGPNRLAFPIVRLPEGVTREQGVSFLVDQRAREFGIRMTLGARPADIWRSVIGQSLRPAMIGIVLGVAAAWSLEPVVRSTVFGWQTSGAEAVAIVVIALLGIAVLSTALPARRAMRVDPATTLRSE